MRVTVEDMANCREQRAQTQREMLAKYSTPLVSFTMNIPGEIKTNPLLQRGFALAEDAILRRLQGAGFHPLEVRHTRAFTGWEMLCAVLGDALAIKKALCPLEEADAFGRLLDIDIIRLDGSKVSREDVGMPPRSCLLCGQAAAVCGRSRAHLAQELFNRVEEIVREKVTLSMARQAGETAQWALLTEAAITPKPGLVDCRNTGAHQDMDLHTFLASAAVLRPYFEQCAQAGAMMAGEEAAQCMPRIRALGLLAQDSMLQATGGVNTHMGAIYGLGILCCAAGRVLERNEALSSDALLKTAGEIAARETDSLKTLAAQGAATGGVRQYVLYGLTGARGQAAEGFPSVRDIGLPVLTQGLDKGLSLNDAGVYALLALMEQVHDSNLIRRGGMEKQQQLMEQVRKMRKEKPALERVRGLDEQLIRDNLSPGGSADLLAFTLFVYRARGFRGWTPSPL